MFWQRLLTSTAVVWIVSAGAGAQEAGRIWQGVFTAEQADRGKASYDQHCVRCHGVDMVGANAPSLKGERFLTTFGSETVDRLFSKIRETMPVFSVTIIDDRQKIDIVAHILRSNGYPAGARELTTASEELAAIEIARKGEQASVTNFSLVQTVGCLARNGDSWMLTNSTEPAATRDDAPNAEALTAAAARPLGSGSFVLLSARPHEPAAHVGHKMEARGLVYRDGSDARITLTSLRMVGAACAG